jgi:hypothetical protein|tara:strand:- start:607 stop:939 length:333 start_codon:yes stop_codon:yes gene_type:complete
MLKLFIGGVIMTAIFGCFIVPNHFYYNVALLNFGFLFTGFMIGLIFYREFETIDIDDSDLEFMDSIKKHISNNDAIKIQQIGEKFSVSKLEQKPRYEKAIKQFQKGVQNG